MGWTVYNSEGQILQSAGVSDNAITTAKILDEAVTYAKLQNLGTADRVLGSTSTGVIGEVQIVPDMLATDAVTTVKILDDNVTTAKILAANVTLAKIASQAANTVLVRDANSSGVVSAKAVADTQVLIGDGTGFTAAALSGEATMSNAGAVLIADNIIDEANLKASNTPANGQVLTARDGVAGGFTWEAAAGGGAITREGGEASEAATTSTSVTEAFDFTSLSIETLVPCYAVMGARQAPDSSTAQCHTGIKLIITGGAETTIGDAGTGSGTFGYQFNDNVVADGIWMFWLGPRDTPDYLHSGMGIYNRGNHAGAETGGHVGRINKDAANPAGTIITIKMRLISLNGATIAMNNGNVYSMAIS